MKNNKLKIVLDTNIFINAIIFPNKNPYCIKTFNTILNMIIEEKAELLFSQNTIGELMYVVKTHIKNNVKKDELCLEAMTKISSLFYYAVSVNTKDTELEQTCDDVNDDMFLKCAKEGNASYLITQDANSGMHKVKGYNFKVVSSVDFVRNLKEIKDKELEMV